VGPLKFSPGEKVSCLAIGTFPVYIALIWNSTVLVNTTKAVAETLYEEGNYTCEATSKYGTDKRVILVEGEKMISKTLLLREPLESYSTFTVCFLFNKNSPEILLFT